MQRFFESNQVAVIVNLIPLEATSAFPYLGRIITYNNSDWAEFYSNLWKSQRRWGVVSKMLGDTGSPIKECAIMYKVSF